MHDSGFFHDEPVGIEFTDVLARIGITDFSRFIGIEPYLPFAAA